MFFTCIIWYETNSGKYKIKFKINNIYNESRSAVNAIGITCNTHDTNKSRYNDWWHCSRDYIAWSSMDKRRKNEKPPSRLICGCYPKYQSKNIFVLPKFQYISASNSYLQGLPSYKSGDIIEMLYDSNNNSLSFFKSNDKSLNSTIILKYQITNTN